MSGLPAILLCSIGVAVLFYLNRDKSVRNSKGLWIPVIWIGLAGSRSISEWLGLSSPSGLQGTLEGSPVDAAPFAALLLIGLAVLLSRRKRTSAYLPLILPILIYVTYCLISTAWAPYPLPAFKRWTKDAGDVAMALIIVTDPEPLEAVRRLFSRVGFILLPLSIVMIRFTLMGRAWDAEGIISTVGVTTNKNSLGILSFLISLGTLWNFRWLLMNKSELHRGRRLAAQGILLACGLYLLEIAHSSTSIACFLLGSGLMLVTYLPAIRKRPPRVHVICAIIFVAGGGAFASGGLGDVAGALGRDASLSGRTLMWSAMLTAVSNPIMGVGFDSFWTSPNAEVFHNSLNLERRWYHADQINEAHNGYLEVFLNLGWVGICLIALILGTGYSHACKAFRRCPEFSSVMLAYIVAGAIYSMTEAGFRTLNPMWIFILLAVVSASGTNARIIIDAKATERRLRAPFGVRNARLDAAYLLHELNSAR